MHLSIPLGADQIHLKSTTSTNEFLRKFLAEQPVREGFAVSAEYQTSGRGQIDNSWESEQGKNLLFSTYLKPTSLKAHSAFQLNMSVCLAIVDCLNDFHPGFLIKWPNDILFDQRKIAGVLIENNIKADQVQTSIVGVGLNLNQIHFKTVSTATSLKQITGLSYRPEDLMNKILKNLEVRYLQMQTSAGRLKADYLNTLYGFNLPVSVRVRGHQYLSPILDVKEDGELVVQMNGRRENFRFKEISFVL